MSKVYRLNGEFIELTDEEVLQAFKTTDNDYPDDLLSHMAKSCLMSAYIYGKPRFDTSKDAKQMMAAADENQKMLQRLLEYQMRLKLQELVEDRLSAQSELGRKDS